MKSLIDRRSFLRSAAALAGCAALDRLWGNAPSDKKPNILLIVTDDQRMDTFGFIKQKALTPNIDSLAENGLFFSRAYTSSPVCTPSRYSSITGRFASRCPEPALAQTAHPNGMYRVRWQTWVQQNEMHIGKILKQAGYVTGFVGKCDVFKKRNYQQIPVDSDPHEPAVSTVLRKNQEMLKEDVLSHGFDYAASLSWANSTDNPCKALRGHNIEWEVKGALDFIEEANERPFFLNFSTTLLHWPDPLNDLKNPDTRRTFMGYLDEPLDVQPSRQSVLDRVKAAGLPESQALATWLDDGIGAIINRLEKLNKMRDTLVIYFNDNGNDHGKGSLYEGGINVPLFLHYKPLIKKGIKSQALVQGIDIVPTMLAVAGVTYPADYVCDGQSLLPIIKNEKDKVRDNLFFEIGNTRAVLTEDNWKYLAYRYPDPLTDEMKFKVSHMAYDHKDFNSIERVVMKHQPAYFESDQLYSLNHDPGEQKNLSRDPVFASKLAEMKSRLKEYLDMLPGTFGELKTKG